MIERGRAVRAARLFGEMSLVFLSLPACRSSTPPPQVSVDVSQAHRASLVRDRGLRVVLRWDHVHGAVVRRIEDQEFVDIASLEDQLRYERDLANDDEQELPVLVDAAVDVPWDDVMDVVQVCARLKLLDLSFTAPQTEVDLDTDGD